MNLNQITIPSRDLTKSVDFYQKLGLVLIVDSIPRYARFECPDGDSTFSVHHVDELPDKNLITIYFECTDLDKKVEECLIKKINFEELPKNQSWLWREAKLFDPDQNPVILYFAGENRKNPPWKVK